MALDYKTLEYKTEMTKTQSDVSIKMKDLLKKTFNNNIDISESYTIVEVTKEYNGRPDLISQAIYHTDAYADILCKINGISNPFELMEGNLIICPGEGIIEKIPDVEISSLDALADDKDELMKKFNTYKKTKDEKRSPNEATVFDHSYVEIPNTNLILY